MTRVSRMMYRVLMMAGRMPLVPRRMLEVVVRNVQLTWGRPRTSTMPMMPTTRTMTKAAAIQTAPVKNWFHSRREGEKSA